MLYFYTFSSFFCFSSSRYFENKVFIALGSGELCIYKRELGGGAWQLSSPEIIHVSITGSAIACMTAVAGRIWCGCQNTIVLVNATSLKLEVILRNHTSVLCVYHFLGPFLDLSMIIITGFFFF